MEDSIEKASNAAFYKRSRSARNGIYVVNGGYDAERGERAVSDGSADAVVYGRHFLANPDLPTRLIRRGPLNLHDPNSLTAATNSAISIIRAGRSAQPE